MAIDFPDNPILGDTFTSGDKTWEFNGASWVIQFSVPSIATGSVTSTKLATDAVTTAKIANDAVTTDKVAAGAIGSTELAASAVTTGKINALAVTTGKLAADSVTSDKIANSQVTNAKLANSSLTLGSTSMSLGTTTSTVSGLANLEVTNFLTLNGVKENVVIESFLGGSEKLYIGESQTLFKNTNASGNFTIDLRGYNTGDNTVYVDTIMAVGDMITAAFVCQNGSTPYYCTDITVNGASQGRTLLWQGGTAPSAGNANSRDVYTITTVKTAAATFVVFAALTRFA